MGNNFFLRIISVIMAIGFWFFVSTSDYNEYSFNVPVKLKNIKNDMVAVNENGLVNVVLRGPSFTLKNISFKEIEVSVDASSFTVGRNFYRIRLSEVKVPAGIDVVRVEPSEVVINIDEVVSKELNLVPTFIGEPKPGFKVSSVNMSPKSLKVVGPKNILDRLDVGETFPINVSERSEPLIYSVGVKLPEGVRVDGSGQVEVYIKFSEDIKIEDIKSFPVVLRGEKDGFVYKLLDSEVSLKVKGRVDKFSLEYLKQKISIYADVSEIDKTGKFLVKLGTMSNDDLEILSVKPEKVRVEVSN